MRQERPSKLDPFAADLEQWFGGQRITLAAARARLSERGIHISSHALGAWWQRHKTHQLQNDILAQIERGAKLCAEIERAFGEHPAPELETLLKMHRTLLLTLTTRAKDHLELVPLVVQLMRAVIEARRLDEQRRVRELAERKLEAQREMNAAATPEGDKARAIRPETLAQIEKDIHLL